MYDWAPERLSSSSSSSHLPFPLSSSNCMEGLWGLQWSFWVGIGGLEAGAPLHPHWLRPCGPLNGVPSHRTLHDSSHFARESATRERIRRHGMMLFRLMLSHSCCESPRPTGEMSWTNITHVFFIRSELTGLPSSGLVSVRLNTTDDTV